MVNQIDVEKAVRFSRFQNDAVCVYASDLEQSLLAAARGADTMPEKKKVGFGTVAFGAGALIAFGLSCYSLVLDRTASAAVSAAFSLVLVLFIQLPILESLEIFTLKAKFTKRLDEFDQVMAHVRMSAASSSAILYTQLAYMNRMGAIPWHKKRSMLSEVDKVLIALDLPNEQLSSMKVPFLNVIAMDILRVFERAVIELCSIARKRVEAERETYSNGKGVPAGDPTWERFNDQIKALSYKIISWEDVLTTSELADVSAITRKILNGVGLGRSDIEKLEIIKVEADRLADECWKAGTITPEAEIYLNKYGNGQSSRLEDIN